MLGQNPSIKEIATEFKLTVFNTCTCGGYYTEKFSDIKGQVTMEWRKGRYLGRLRKRNEVIIDWTSVDKLIKGAIAYYG